MEAADRFLKIRRLIYCLKKEFRWIAEPNQILDLKDPGINDSPRISCPVSDLFSRFPEGLQKCTTGAFQFAATPQNLDSVMFGDARISFPTSFLVLAEPLVNFFSTQ